jgi:hypothetical protein
VEVHACVRVARAEDKASKVIDQVLTQVFGEKAACLIYKYLERNYSLKRDDIVDKIDVFAKGLEEFLSSGASVVEQKILDDLQRSSGLVRGSEDAGFEFADRMKLLTGKA